MRSHVTAMAIGCLMLAVVGGCSRTTGGAAGPTVTSDAVTTPPWATPVPSTGMTTSTAEPSTETMPAYGVVETSKHPVASGEVTCGPGPASVHAVEVKGTDPGAPILTVAVPQGFTPGPGAAALNLTGPEGITGAVRIAPTTLPAAKAFQQYADERTAGYDINSVSILPAELCDYSGRELMGVLAQGPGQGVHYRDRIVHVWTGGGDYLVSVQVQAPADAEGLDQAASVLLSDFGIRMS